MASAANDLFIPAAERVSLALGGGLGAILILERHRLRTVARSTLFVRWRTWLVTAPVFGAAIMWSRWVTLGFAVGLAIVAAREYGRLTDLDRTTMLATQCVVVVLPTIAALDPVAWRVALPYALLAMTALPIVRADTTQGPRQVAFASLGAVYIGASLAFMLQLRSLDGGPAILLALGTAVAVSDVAAFVTGKVLGSRPLAFRLSPAKTWEGALGNVVGAYAGFALMAVVVPASLTPVIRALLPLTIAIGCVWGDLFESLLKRSAGVKDAGSWIPGFGGLLDRIDSLLFALPLSCAVLEMLG